MLNWMRGFVGRIVSFQTGADVVLLAGCLWALEIQMQYRVLGGIMFHIIPVVGIVLLLLGFLSLAVRLVSFAFTKKALQQDLQKFQWIGYSVLAGFIGFGAVLYLNGKNDRSVSVEYKSEVLDVSKGEFDLGGFIPYAQADFRSWQDQNGVFRIFVHSEEERILWVKEPVVIKVHQGALGIPWIAQIENDEEVYSRQVLKLLPNAAEAHKRLVQYYYDRKRWGEGTSEAIEYLKIYPNDHDMAITWAGELGRHFEDRRAVGLLEPLVAHRPDYRLLHTYGWQLHKSGNGMRAVEVLKGAVTLDPGNWSAYYSLGYVYQRLGRQRDALEAFEKLLTLHPHYPEIQQEITQLRQSIAGGSP